MTASDPASDLTKRKPGIRLGDLVVALGYADAASVENAARLARIQRRRLGELLCELTGVTEEELFTALARQRGVPLTAFETIADRLDRSLVEAVPRAFLERHHMLPVLVNHGELLIATCEPDGSELELADALRAKSYDTVLVTPTDYKRLWKALDLADAQDDFATAQPAIAASPHSSSNPSPSRSISAPAIEEARFSTTRSVSLAGREVPAIDRDASPVEIIDAMLQHAVGERASDVHLERYPNELRVRVRVDGSLRDLVRLPISVQDTDEIVNVLKINARLDISERRLPQGGRLRRTIGPTTYDLRVQTQPSFHGENVVLRLRPEGNELLRIDEIGFPEDVAREYTRLLDSPAGLVLVVGPTGSGKTTTLYAGVQKLATDPSRKVITVEDPVEFPIAGIQQCDVQPEAGFRFADAMRAFVREDPDVILLGEIRDHETALETLRASQTGHLVMSTLHCNDAVDAVQRLLDLGMHPNSVASELLAVVAQHLVRRVCEHCKVETQPEADILAELFPEGLSLGLPCYKGVGCAQCGGTGTLGRIAAVEYLRLGPTMRRSIARALPLDELRRVAIGNGLRTLRDSLLDLVTRGVIPLAEVPTVLPFERMAGEGN